MSEDLIQVRKLSKRQKEVLQMLADGEEIVFEKGGGWWIGDNRTSGKLVMTLLRYMTLKADDYSDNKIQRFEINGTGRQSLKSGWLYIHKDLLKSQP